VVVMFASGKGPNPAPHGPIVCETLRNLLRPESVVATGNSSGTCAFLVFSSAAQAQEVDINGKLPTQVSYLFI
jgi:hypothetical protein